MGNSTSYLNLNDCLNDEKNTLSDKESLLHSYSVSKFDPANYPYPIEFDFVTNEGTRPFLLSAYNTISRLDKWKVMYEYAMDKDIGFMTTHEDEMDRIVDEIEQAYSFQTDHSGFTIKYTMRNMEYLAKNGIGEFKKLWGE